MNPLSHALESAGVTLPTSRLKSMEDWRALNPAPVGQIHGIPTIRGRLIATNGVLGIVRNMHCGQWWDVHVAFFVPDDEEEFNLTLEVKKEKKTEKQKLTEELLASI